MADGSPLFRVAFLSLVAGVALALVSGFRRAAQHGDGTTLAANRAALGTAAALALWLAFTGRLAATGFLTFAPRPTIVPLLVLGLLAGVGLAVSGVGRRLVEGLPIALLVGFQIFRIPVELLLDQGRGEGLVPPQMTFRGMNFDLLTGILAGLLALLSQLGPVPRWLIAAWNLIGFGLLANVVTIAMLSAPTPLRVFFEEPANVWITRWPWIWLPAFLVPVALFGHVLVLRWLFVHPSPQRGGAATAAGAASRGL